MSSYKLTAEQIHDNHQKFLSLLTTEFSGDRSAQLTRLYRSLDEDFIFAPASSYEHFHNAIPGGYIDHVLRVVDFSLKFFNHWTSLGLDTSNITREEVVFSALNHDLGKLGYPGEGNLQYEHNKSKWHRENQGKIYQINEKLPFMPVPDRSLFVLQQFQISLSYNEYTAIKLHDGLYDETNKPYYISRQPSARLRSYLPFILHQADQAATFWEFAQWNSTTLKVPTTNSTSGPDISQPTTPTVKGSLHKAVDKAFEDFDKMFEEL